MRRVVVTGVGLLTSIGNNASITWANLIGAKSGIKRIPERILDDSSIFGCQIASYIYNKEEDEILGFEPGRNVSNGHGDRFIQLGIAAAQEAIDDSGIKEYLTEEMLLRSGVLLGSGIGGLISIEKECSKMILEGPKRVSPFFIPDSLVNLLPGYVSIAHGFKGPNYSQVSACASGAHSIGDATRLIACNEADVMIAGAAEAAICKLGISGFDAMRTLCRKYNESPESASRPWDRDKAGFVMGEGAGILILEEMEFAKARGAKIYGEVVGYAATSDAYHITSPDSEGDGGYRAMTTALARSGLKLSDIGYINAHATSTKVGDVAELRAIRRLFIEEDINLDAIPISSTKSAIGHLLGAAGSVEAIFGLLAMRDGIIPPTLNLDNPDDEAIGFNLVPHRSINHSINAFMSNSFGFGGTNVSLIFKKVTCCERISTILLNINIIVNLRILCMTITAHDRVV